MNSASQDGRLPQWKRIGIGDSVHSSLHPRRTGFRTVTHKETTMPDSIGEIAQRHGFSAAPPPMRWPTPCVTVVVAWRSSIIRSWAAWANGARVA